MRAYSCFINTNLTVNKFFIQQVKQIETSFNNETPLRGFKNMTVKTEHTAVAKALFCTTSEEEDNLLLNNMKDIQTYFKKEDVIEEEQEVKELVESTSDVDDEDQSADENQKYIEVLKKYWGYTSFRK